MKNDETKDMTFKVLCLAVAIGSFTASCFAFQHSIVLFILCIVTALWALVSFVGSIIAIRYLEGCVVHYLISLGGSAKKEQINDRYTIKYGNSNFVISSLKSRGVVSIENEVVVLHPSAIDRGFNNSIMRWSTRKLYNQSLESDVTSFRG